MLSTIKSYLSAKLKDKNYRHKFFKGRTEDDVASQLIEFRKKRRLSQAALAKLCGMKQSAVSRIEKSSYSRWNFTTLWRVAKALDVRVQVIFTDMADVIAEYERRECDVRPTAAEITNEATVCSVGGSTARFIPLGEPLNPATFGIDIALWQVTPNVSVVHKTNQGQATVENPLH